MIYEEHRGEVVDRMKVDRVELYSKLDFDIIMVRPVWGRNPIKPKHIAPYEWVAEGSKGY
ncbi:MAG: hypothetical protein QXQ29_05655 [Candidatus Bathyarchaeia archaeon]